MNVLWVSRDAFNALEMRPLISQRGYGLVHVPDLSTAVEAVTQQAFALGIIELGSVAEDEGRDICRRFVEASPFPVIAMSCPRSKRFKRSVFEAGAIDHVTQPFDRELLMAQINAILRLEWPRESKESDQGEMREIQIGVDVTLDTKQRVLIVNGEEKCLTPTEFRLLWYMVERAGRVLAREELLSAVWGCDFTGNGREVDVYISYLRKKLEPQPEDPERIITHWGLGYQFVSGPECTDGAKLSRVTDESEGCTIDSIHLSTVP